MAASPSFRRRKVYPNDTFTWLSITATAFLVLGVLVVMTMLESRYHFFRDLFGK